MGGSLDEDMAAGTYVFCVIASDRRPAPRPRRRGLPGQGPVRLLAVDDQRPRLWLVVADAPLAQYGDPAINRRLSDLQWVARAAVAHESVVESFIESATVVPMKLFTIFSSDERALHHVTAERRRVESVLRRVSKHHEWGVRVALDGGPILRRQSPGGVRRAKAPESGAGYLSSKREQRDRAAERRTRARTVTADLYERLEREAAEGRRRAPRRELPAKGGPLLLDAAFLVPRSRSRRFAAIVSRLRTRLAAEGYRVTMTGPWPPYTFVQD